MIFPLFWASTEGRYGKIYVTLMAGWRRAASWRRGEPAHAQVARTWVSGTGSDSNASSNCSITAPCQTFAGAIAVTSAGGEIDVLSPGGYGTLTITKAISIINDGAGEAGVLASGANGITISAGPGDVVNLRGLFVNGIGAGIDGIAVTSGGTVNVQNCLIQGFASIGLFVEPSSGTTAVKIQDSTIIQNGAGVEFKPSGGATVTAFVDHTRIDHNTGGGLRADGSGGGPVNVAVSDSSISGNSSNGVNAVSGSGGNVNVDMSRDIVALNGLTGIQANVKGGTSTVTVGELDAVE